MKQLPRSPILATAGDSVPLGDGWRYEVKWDGIRAVVAVDDDGVHVWSRHGTVLTAAFPELAGVAGELPAGTVLDGELVVCDDDGRLTSGGFDAAWPCRTSTGSRRPGARTPRRSSRSTYCGTPART